MSDQANELAKLAGKYRQATADLETARTALIAHIKKRAEALGAEDQLPPDWMSTADPVENLAADPPKRHNGYTKLREMMKAKFDELMAMVKDDDGDGMPDEPAHEGMTADIPPATQPAAEAVAEAMRASSSDDKTTVKAESTEEAATSESGDDSTDETT